MYYNHVLDSQCKVEELDSQLHIYKWISKTCVWSRNGKTKSKLIQLVKKKVLFSKVFCSVKVSNVQIRLSVAKFQPWLTFITTYHICECSNDE